MRRTHQQRPDLPARTPQNRSEEATRRAAPRGFSLVELLVVMGIIALLASLLIPAIMRARNVAQSMTCLNNLRNLNQMAMNYAIDYDDRLPLAYYYVADENKMYCWDVTTTGMAPDITYEPGMLWYAMDLGSADSAVHQCPEIEEGEPWTGEQYTGYNYNSSYLAGYALNIGGNITISHSVRLGMIKKPEECAMFGDGEWSGGPNKFMRAPFGDKKGGDEGFTGRYAGTQGYRHMGKTNVVFADGHAVSWPERHTESYPHEVPNIAEGTGFLSEDDELYDLQ